MRTHIFTGSKNACRKAGRAADAASDLASSRKTLVQIAVASALSLGKTDVYNPEAGMWEAFIMPEIFFDIPNGLDFWRRAVGNERSEHKVRRVLEIARKCKRWDIAAICEQGLSEKEADADEKKGAGTSEDLVTVGA